MSDLRLKQDAEPSVVAPLQERGPADPLALKDRALDVTAEGVTIADARLAGRPLIYANEGFERVTGCRASGVLGRNCRFLQGSYRPLPGHLRWSRGEGPGGLGALS